MDKTLTSLEWTAALFGIQPTLIERALYRMAPRPMLRIVRRRGIRNLKFIITKINLACGGAENERR